MSEPKPHISPDVALIQEALEYQEANSLQGPLFPEAQEELRRLVEQLGAVTKQRDAIMAMLEAERPPDEVFAYARSLSNPANSPLDTPDDPMWQPGDVPNHDKGES